MSTRGQRSWNSSALTNGYGKKEWTGVQGRSLFHYLPLFPFSCPVIGCRNRDFITNEHLYDDPYIRAQLQNQAANDTEEADPDETIEDSEMITLNDSMLPL